jgi:hypothetical protein
MRNFWLPEFKYQLVEWLNRYDKTVNWNRKPKKQLMAIYLTIRRKMRR